MPLLHFLLSIVQSEAWRHQPLDFLPSWHYAGQHTYSVMDGDGETMGQVKARTRTGAIHWYRGHVENGTSAMTLL